MTPTCPTTEDSRGAAQASIRKTRLAPSPTGALHLGNARTFLATWLLARQSGWRIVLRIEDLDGPRVKRGADHLAIDDLVWLGLNWDEGPIYQSPRSAIYSEAIERLCKRKRAYPCVCSRRETILASSAPHADEVQAIYPGTCRDRYQSTAQAKSLSGKPPAVRFRVPPGVVEFNDGFAGAQRFDVAKQLGDFVIAKADGTAAYHLAVVIDDAEMGITDVVRGNDLIDSTPRQILLYRALDLAAKIPNYIHLPLVVGTDGKRLAKRHGDTRISHYRERGVPPGAVVAMLARWLGINNARHDETGLAKALIGRFDLSRLRREHVVFDEGSSPLLATTNNRKWNSTTDA